MLDRGGEAPANREAFGRALIGVLSREHSISPQDIDFASTNIAVLTEQGPKRVSNCVVVYDVVYGGIRLTEDLFDRFQEYLGQISRASDLAGSDAIVTKELAAKLEAWASTLETGEADERTAPVVSDGWYQIYKPGSVVSIYHHGHLVSRELVAPKLLDLLGDGSLSLYYSYKLGGKRSVVPHEQVHPLGEDWSYVLWSPETNEIRELDFDDASQAVDQNTNGHWVKVYRPGTRIKVQHHGQTVEREIVEAKLVKDQESNGYIEYAYIDGGGYGYVPHHCVQPTGNDWSLVLWNPDSLLFKELDQ